MSTLLLRTPLRHPLQMLPPPLLLKAPSYLSSLNKCPTQSLHYTAVYKPWKAVSVKSRTKKLPLTSLLNPAPWLQLALLLPPLVVQLMQQPLLPPTAKLSKPPSTIPMVSPVQVLCLQPLPLMSTLTIKARSPPYHRHQVILWTHPLLGRQLDPKASQWTPLSRPTTLMKHLQHSLLHP